MSLGLRPHTSFVSYVKKTGDKKITNASIYDQSQMEIALKRAKETAISSISRASLNADCILWIIPLFGVQYYEAAFSQDVLKYRSIAGQYLAKQPGGQHSLRIDAKLQGPLTSMYLSLLQLLYIRGSKSEEINKGLKAMYGNNIDGMVEDSFSTNSTNVKDLEQLKSTMDTNSEELSEISKNDFKWMRSKYHKTFNVTTKEFVIFDVYIESLIYWQDHDTTDRDTINVSILFHKFIEPPYITDVFIGKAIEEDTKSFEAALKEEVKAGKYIPPKYPPVKKLNLTKKEMQNTYKINTWKALKAMNLLDSPMLYTRANMKRSYIKTKKLDTQANNYTDLHLNLINIASTELINAMFNQVNQKPGDYNLQNRNIRNMGLYGFVVALNYASVWPKITNKIYNAVQSKKPQYTKSGTLIVNQMTQIGGTSVIKPLLDDWETGLLDTMENKIRQMGVEKEMVMNDKKFVFEKSLKRISVIIKNKDNDLLSYGPWIFDISADANYYYKDNGLYYIVCFRQFDAYNITIYIITYSGRTVQAEVKTE